MSAVKKVVLALVAIVVLFVVAVAVAAATIDPNKYRAQIADTLGKQIDRTVTLGGPIKFTVTMHGIGLDIQDVAIGNPSWASRPEMAKIGQLELGVALMPLLSHQLVITQFNVSNADIQLETSSANQNNWDLKPAASSEAAPVASAKTSAAGSPVGIRVNELSVTDSQLAMRGKDGKVSIFRVKKMSLKPASEGLAVNFDGDVNGAPVTLTVATGTFDLMTNAKWPFQADAGYDKYHFKAKGEASLGAKIVSMDSYELSAGGSALHGELTANLAGATPVVKGTLAADKLDVADFKPAAPASEEKPAANDNDKAPVSGAPRLFSTAPLDLGALKSANAAIDVNIGAIKINQATLDQFTAKLQLADGHLTLNPFKATLGNSVIEGEVKLDAAGPSAQYSLALKAPGVQIADLLHAAGTSPFMTGKGDADIELSGSGASAHDLAASTDGHITVTAADGTISSAAAGSVASGLMQILAPGGNGNPTLNCLAARYVVTNGVAKDNGILMDSSASTVAGTGGFDLGAETINMTVRAKPKLVNTGGFLPPLDITGPLAGPHFNIDTASAVKNVAAGFLAKGNLSGLLGGNKGNTPGSATNNSVPVIQTATAGENACVYTLDHKAAATAAAPGGSAPGSSGTTANPIKNIGSKLKGLLGQ